MALFLNRISKLQKDDKKVKDKNEISFYLIMFFVLLLRYFLTYYYYFM